MDAVGSCLAPKCLLWSLSQKIRREAPQLASSWRATAVPGENAVAMPLETQSIAKPCFLLLCFLLWISTQIANHHKPGVTKGTKAPCCVMSGGMGPASGDGSMRVPTGPLFSVPELVCA